MIVTDTVEGYLRSLVPEPDAVLAEMRKHGDRDDIPIVVPEAGALLSVLVTLAAPRLVVEVGTAIGVSTLHIARALPEGGRIISFEVDPDRHAAARAYLDRAGMLDRADLRLQDAGAGLEALDGPVDMVFLDGLKGDYPRHLALALPLLRPGGMVAVDNMLMSGAVAAGRGDGHWSDEAVADMRAFTRSLLDDDRLVATVLPVGDGVAVAVRR
jgi:predicted O-methyltransferase YrrM